MRITHHGTLLRTINGNDIEQIRIWRNRTYVNRYLLNRKFIEPQEQVNWFKSLNPHNSIYFVMEERMKPFGVIYARNIDFQTKRFEGSIFTGDEDFMETFLPAKAALMLSIFFFENLQFQIATSIVHSDNSNALELDMRLGYREIKTENGYIISECSSQSFELSSRSFKKLLLRNEPIGIEIEPDDQKFPFLQELSNQQY
jgi:hypothetical protein